MSGVKRRRIAILDLQARNGARFEEALNSSIQRPVHDGAGIKVQIRNDFLHDIDGEESKGRHVVAHGRD